MNPDLWYFLIQPGTGHTVSAPGDSKLAKAKKQLREAYEKERAHSRCVKKLKTGLEHTVGALEIEA